MLQTFMFLGNWRNYSDRIIKKSPANSSEMWDAVADWPYAKYVPNVNFDIGDGIDSSVIVEWTDRWIPNYVWITANIDGGANKIQGWFVMEFEQTRGQQFRAVLHRDVIADNYDDVLNATSFIEKAALSPDDPLVFNNEGMTFNQIKQEETLLKDRTGVSWIVGYLANNTNSPEDLKYTGRYLDVPYTAAKIVAEDNSFNYSQTAVDVSNLSFADIINYSTSTDKRFKNITNLDVGVQTRREDAFAYYQLSYVLNFSKQYSKPARNEFISAYTNYSNSYVLDNEDYRYHQESILDTYRAAGAHPIKEYLLENGKDDIYNSISVDGYVSLRATLFNYMMGYPGFRNDLSTILSYNNRIIKSGNSYYKLKVSETPLGSGTMTSRGNGWLTSVIQPFLTTAFTTLSTNLGNSVRGMIRNNVNTIKESSYLLGVKYKEYRVDAIEITSTTLNTLITNSYVEENESVDNIVRNQLSDSPYDMFAIPYVDENGNGITLQSSLRIETRFTTTGDTSLRIAQAIARDFGDACYDLQIVPYCPIPEVEPEMIIGTKLRQFRDYTLIRLGDTAEDGDIVGVVFFPNTSKGTLDIVAPIDGGSSAVEKKIINECETYKLCSPNFSGEFEFSPAKNGGVEYFNVDYLYKPFSPYIHVNPNFGGLYGTDFNDARGLICGGSFSAGSVKSAWTNYELNNKNYAEIFDRQIHSLDVNNNIAMTQQKVSAGIGVLQGGMSGMITGAMVGGGVGAAAGAIIGTGSSLAGGIVDTQLLARQQKEQKSYQIDMYGYNLGNIKAIPYSLSSVSSLTNNNKLFPFVEKYSCTDEEKEIFRLKLKYDGMTVMRIGQIKDYILTDDNFIRATLIRSTDISEDNHMIETIYSELRKGVYL